MSGIIAENYPQRLKTPNNPMFEGWSIVSGGGWQGFAGMPAAWAEETQGFKRTGIFFAKYIIIVFRLLKWFFLLSANFFLSSGKPQNPLEACD